MITGASGGIGTAIAKKFAKEGYAVVLQYHRNKSAIDNLTEVLPKGEFLVIQADLRDSQQVDSMVQQVQDVWGNVDVLVNNAGIAQQKIFSDITDEDWQNMMGVHVDGTFFCIRAVLQGMLHQKKGSIINISSMWGQVGGACEVHYSAAKGAVQAMTKALAKEVGPSGVRVNCVAPGMIQTPMNAFLDDEAIHVIAEETPMNRIGMPEDVAEAVLFLADDNKATFITGQILAVNGGLVV